MPSSPSPASSETAPLHTSSCEQVHALALHSQSGAKPPALWIDAVEWSSDGRFAVTAESLHK